MNIDIRSLSADQIPELLDMIKEFYLLEHLPYNELLLNKCIEELMRNDEPGIIRIVFNESRIIGYFVLTFGYSFEFHGTDALLDEFYIREEFRGKGMGTACLKYIENFCRNRNIKAVHLVVDRNNIAAKELYRRNGYAEHDRYILTKWI